jgi:hypothetical protein
MKKTLSGGRIIEGRPKKTRQGDGKNTKNSARPNKSRRKLNRGQG